MKTLHGSCLCQKVQIEIPDDFDYMGNCHCSECRKFTGSDYSSVGGLDSEKFTLTSGFAFVSTYPKSDETELAFCRECESSLYPLPINIRLGILDDTPTHRPSFHIFTVSKAPWNDITDNLTQFEKAPTKS